LTPIKTGILFFSRSPYRESQHKKIHADRQKNFKALHLLHHWVKKTITATKIPSFELSEKEQVGSTFGERLSHGLGNLFSLGYDRIIVVGNDCPSMDPEDLLRAREQLEAGNMILGHNVVGGAYIFGISKEAFSQEAFEALPWSSPELGFALKNHLLKHGDLIELEVKEDINTEDDLYQVRSSSLSLLIILLRKLFRSFRHQVKELPIPHACQFSIGQPFRDPPSYRNTLFI